MCSPAFSWSINKKGDFFYKENILSHSAISEHFSLPDDYVIKAEYNWWELFIPDKIIWHSLPFEPSESMIRNSINLVKKYFHSKDATFEWVKNNFLDHNVPGKFIETFDVKDVLKFFSTYNSELPANPLLNIVKYTLNSNVASAAFDAGIDRFNTDELFFITRFCKNEKVRYSAFQAGKTGFSGEQLAKICLTINDENIVKEAFETGLNDFSVTNLTELAINLNVDGIDEKAFKTGIELFETKQLSKIIMNAKSFTVRNEAEKAYSVSNPRMDY